MNITMVEKDSALIRVAVFDSDNRPMDLKDYSAYLYLAGIDVSVGSEVVDNLVTFTIPKDYVEKGPIDYEVVIDDGERKYTIVQGTIITTPWTTERR